MKTNYLFLFLISLLIFTSCRETPKEEIVKNEIIIEGITVGTDAKQLVLKAPYQDFRFDSLITIPIVNHTFSHRIESDHRLFFELFLDEGTGRYMPLFLDKGTTNLTIYNAEHFDDNIVKGSVIQDEYNRFKEIVDDPFNNISDSIGIQIKILRESDDYYTKEGFAIEEKYNKATTQSEKVDLRELRNVLQEERRYLTETAQELENLRELSWNERQERLGNYMKENINLISFYGLTSDLQYKENLLEFKDRKNLIKKLEDKYPNHPYIPQTTSMIESQANPIVGNKYVDITAPDLNGNSVKLSDEIKGKVTILDLWGTWCGPCIAKTNKLKPLYKKYKNQNFTMIGVAGEYKNTNALKSFLQNNEDWTWQQLVELEREHKIWEKYAIDGGGGGIFLIDKNGKVIAKSPSYDQVENAILNQ